MVVRSNEHAGAPACAWKRNIRRSKSKTARVSYKKAVMAKTFCFCLTNQWDSRSIIELEMKEYLSQVTSCMRAMRTKTHVVAVQHACVRVVYEIHDLPFGTEGDFVISSNLKPCVSVFLKLCAAEIRNKACKLCRRLSHPMPHT